jgi:hypothetical protein
MAMQNGKEEFVPALEEGLVRVIKQETGLSPEALLAMDFQARREQLAKIGVHLQDPKPNRNGGRTMLSNG